LYLYTKKFFEEADKVALQRFIVQLKNPFFDISSFALRKVVTISWKMSYFRYFSRIFGNNDVPCISVPISYFPYATVCV